MTGLPTAAGLWSPSASIVGREPVDAIHRCRRCGRLSSNRTAADDNPMKLMSVALKPLAQPPFPLEHIERLTALMGGSGSIE